MNLKTIVTIGTGYSGSSAIYEFLSSSDSFHDPFPNIEFSLTYDPGGIMDIEQCIKNNFSINKTKVIYDQFKKNINLYTNKNFGLKPGKGMLIKGSNIKNLLAEYLQSLVELKYEGQSLYLKYNDTLLSNFFSKMRRKFGKKNTKEMLLFCNEDDFHSKTAKFFDNIFNINNHQKKNILLDQGGSIWNPHSSTKYYSDPRCILTYRDPRDIFSEFKTKSAFSYPGNNVKIFCNWYKKILSNINSNELKKSNILSINFEDFVYKDAKTLQLISEHISKEVNDININFDFSKSIRNIKRYKKNLSQKEINIIEKDLKEYLYH